MEQFINLHKQQLETFKIPEYYWPTLYEKLSEEIFDSGSVFSLLKFDYEDTNREPHDPIWRVQVNDEAGIDMHDPKHIYLVDHAWTYQIADAKNKLRENSNLLHRLCNMFDINYNENSEDCVNSVFQQTWKYNLGYNILNNIQQQMPVWFIMDELGTAIEHSDTPTFNLVPCFLYLPQAISYSLIYPRQSLEFGEVVTRDFVDSGYDDLTRKALLLPVSYYSFLDVDYTQTEPTADYFQEGHVSETLPTKPQDIILNGYHMNCKPVKKVYTDYQLIKDKLTDQRFSFSDCQTDDDVDIIWINEHFKDYHELSETRRKTFINQFPFEHVITTKDLLSVVCRRIDGLVQFDRLSLESIPKIIPTTFNLKTELIKFVSYFQNRSENNFDNYWIIKPFNLSRGIDIHVTDNLFMILKLASQTSVPRICQKYIIDPVLFFRSDINCSVKFDLRVIVILEKLTPLTIYTYKNFFIRFANKQFDLSDLDDYEKHFTVMNYTQPHNLYNLECSLFLELWKQQYPQFDWSQTVQKQINTIIVKVFRAALKQNPPRGISPSEQSRAMYGADFILEWDKKTNIEPRLLEINWAPDCQRACDLYPSFFNDVFDLLFCYNDNDNFNLL